MKLHLKMGKCLNTKALMLWGLYTSCACADQSETMLTNLKSCWCGHKRPHWGFVKQLSSYKRYQKIWEIRLYAPVGYLLFHSSVTTLTIFGWQPPVMSLNSSLENGFLPGFFTLYQQNWFLCTYSCWIIPCSCQTISPTLKTLSHSSRIGMGWLCGCEC